MAASCTIVSNKQKEVEKISFDWTADSDGDCSGKSTATFSGCIKRVVIIPDDTDTPTDQYDVVINDDDGIDVLAGAGADCPGGTNAATLHLTPVTTKKVETLICNTKLTLQVSNAGDSKKGKVYVFIR